MKLFIVIANGGDGSAACKYTLDPAVIERLRQTERDGTIDYERWVGGDGLQIDTLNVPDDSTYKSLGILYPMQYPEE